MSDGKIMFFKVHLTHLSSLLCAKHAAVHKFRSLSNRKNRKKKLYSKSGEKKNLTVVKFCAVSARANASVIFSKLVVVCVCIFKTVFMRDRNLQRSRN